MKTSIKIQAQRPLIVAMLLAVCFSQVSFASTGVSINPTYRGYTNGFSNWRGSNADNFYYAQASGPQYRNFFVYDLGSVNNVWIINASLRLRQGTTNYSGAKTLTLREFDKNSAFSPSASFGDAGSGEVLGSGSFTNYGSSSYINFDLNNTGRNVIQNTILGAYGTNYFGLGGQLSAPSGRYAFDFTRGTPSDSQLVLHTKANSYPRPASIGQSIILGEGVQFDASFSYDPDSIYGDSIVNYLWDIDNDGSVDISQSNSTLDLSAADLAFYGLGVGSYTVRLQVVDQLGLIGPYTARPSLDITAAAIPEPSTLLFGAVASMGILVRRRRRGSDSGFGIY